MRKKALKNLFALFIAFMAVMNITSDNTLFAANDPVSVTLTAPTEIDTFGLDGIAAPDLAVNVSMTVNQDHVTGIQIRIPVETAPNGTAYYYFDPDKNTVWPAVVKNVEYDNDSKTVIITLKDNIEQGTNNNLYLYFSFDQTYWRKVLPGTVLWDTVDGTVTETFLNTEKKLSTEAIKTTATDDRQITATRMNPVDDKVSQGSVSYFRVIVYNSNYYKVDFDENIQPKAVFYFPAGTQFIDTAGYTQGVAEDGRVTLTRVFPVKASDWTNYHYGGTATTGGIMQSDIRFMIPGDAGDKKDITGELTYALAGQSQASVQKTMSMSYTIVESKVWDLKISDYNSSGGVHISDCNNRPDSAVGITTMFTMGYHVYGHSATTRNQGTGDIGGVEYVMNQPASGSAKVNYNTISVTSDVESADYLRTRFQYWFVIKDGKTGQNRTTGKTSTLSGTNFVLPALAENEYVDEVHIEPTGADGSQPGVLPAKNSMSVRVQIKTWPGAKWPDGTNMPFNTTLITPWKLYYNNAQSARQTFSSKGTTHRYADYGTGSSSTMVNVDPKGNNLTPASNVNFEIRGFNYNYQSPTEWRSPVVVVKTLPNLKYVSHGNLYSGANATSLNTDQGAVKVDILHEGNDYNMYRFTLVSKTYAVPKDSAEPRFRIPVAFHIKPGTATGTYKITQTAESSEVTEPYPFNHFMALDNVPGGESMKQYGFDIPYPSQPENTENQHAHFSGASGNYTVVDSQDLTASTKILGSGDDQTIGYHGTDIPGIISAGGTGKMILTISNNGNIDVRDLKLYDIIPHIGDKALLSNEERNTQWNPIFGGLSVNVYNPDGSKAVLNSSANLYYSAARDPKIPQIGRVWGTEEPAWTTTAPGDMNTVGSFYYDFGTNILGSGQYITIEMTYKVPLGAEVDPDLTAYNSFAYAGAYYKGPAFLANIVTQEPTPYGMLKALPSTLCGTVYDVSKGLTEGIPNVPVGGAAVKATDIQNPAKVYTTVADPYGFYSFPNIQTGSHVKIEVSADHFVSNHSFTDVTVSGDSEVNIPLTPIYPVTWVTNGGNPAPSQNTVVYLESVNAPGTMTKTGHTFDGWYRDENFQNQAAFPVENVTEPQTYYAKWNKNIYNVIFDSMGGSDVPGTTAEFGSNIVKPQDPQKDGFIFMGWYNESGCIKEWIFSTDLMPANDKTLYAKWSPAPTPSPTEAPTETPTAAPTEEITAVPLDTPTEEITAAPSDTPAEAVTESPTDIPTEETTVTPTETATESPGGTPTEEITATPADTPTEIITESPTATPTETVTEAPVERTTLPVISSTPLDTSGNNPTEFQTETPDIKETVSPEPTETTGEIITPVPTHSSVATQAPGRKKDPDTGEGSAALWIMVMISCISAIFILGLNREKLTRTK